MKIRNGFVSNSSSSSYVIYVEKSNFDEVFKSSNDITKKIIKAIRTKNKVKFYNYNLVELQYIFGDSSSIDYYDIGLTNNELEEVEDKYWTTYIDKFIKELKKHGDIIQFQEDI